ncbi:MAG: hypothetical protein NC218_08165 [Acetobacter sp.]|nr:hypothetical protein [Acetobacter sp.]
MNINQLCDRLNGNRTEKLEFFKALVNAGSNPYFLMPFYVHNVFTFNGYVAGYMAKYLAENYSYDTRGTIHNILKNNLHNRMGQFSTHELEPILEKLTIEEIEGLGIPDYYFDYEYIPTLIVRKYKKKLPELVQKSLPRFSQLELRCEEFLKNEKS